MPKRAGRRRSSSSFGILLENYSSVTSTYAVNAYIVETLTQEAYQTLVIFESHFGRTFEPLSREDPLGHSGTRKRND